MNRLVLFIIVLLSVLTSCGTQKTYVSQEVQTEMQASQIDSTDLQRQIDRMVRATVDEFLDKEIAQDMTIERKVWSPPDTAGNQYIVQEETVKSVTVAKEVKKAVSQATAETVEHTDSVSVSASVEDLEMDTTVDVEAKDGLPWWQKTLMIIGAAVLTVIVTKIVLKLI